MKIVHKQVEVVFNKKDREALQRVSDILDDISEVSKSQDLTTADGSVYSAKDVDDFTNLIYCLTLGNPNIGDLDDDEEGEDD